MKATKIYYLLKPILPRSIQLLLRKMLVNKIEKKNRTIWPISPRSNIKPSNWSGWPGNKKFCLILTHDVDTAKGQEKIEKLIHLDHSFGFKTSFGLVPDKYKLNKSLLSQKGENVELYVHDLKHDGKLLASENKFIENAVRINTFLKDWNAVGFRAGSMHHNLSWFSYLNVLYDMSTFDTDPFEPMADGVDTIFPFLVQRKNGSTYVEIPYTLPQDFTLFILMKKTNDLWKRKLDWIVEKGGMALLNTHPDYAALDGSKPNQEEYPVCLYENFLNYIKERYDGQFWNPLPKTLAAWWKKREI